MKTNLKGKTTILGAAVLVVVLVSAMFFCFSGVLPVSAPPSEIIVDNTAASFVGSWPTSTSASGYYGSNYQYNFKGTGADTCTWPFTITTTGSYEVYARWTSWTNRATDAPYTVNHKDGSNTVDKNQEVNGGTWQLLGTYNFNAAAYSVRLTDNADDIVIADAIRLVYIPFAVSDYLSIPASAFTPQSNDQSFSITTSLYSTTATASWQEFFAPIQLPSGAEVKSVTAYYYDASSYYMEFDMYRTQITSTYSFLNMTQFTSSGSSGYGHTADTTINEPTINNELYSYCFKALIYGGQGTSLRLYYVTIEFEPPT